MAGSNREPVSPARPVIADVPERERYEARVPGLADVADVAAAYYHRRDGAIALTHTEVPPSLEGHGIGSALARFALDDARRRALVVLPYCPFIAAFLRRHTEYLDLVPADARERFGLLPARPA